MRVQCANDIVQLIDADHNDYNNLFLTQIDVQSKHTVLEGNTHDPAECVHAEQRRPCLVPIYVETQSQFLQYTTCQADP